MLENNQKELVLLKDLGMSYPTNTSKYKARFGLYKCFCGNEFKTQIQDIKHNHTKSCGCLHKKMKNLSSHRLYGILTNMINRCEDISNIHYGYYGGRGITVCDEWKNFISFFEWSINNRYEDNLTIDRINNNFGYSPSNCRWTTKEVQSRNTKAIHKHNTSGYRGVSLHKKTNRWRARITVSSKEISLGYFDTAINGAKAYDKYVIENNLEHTKNFS